MVSFIHRGVGNGSQFIARAFFRFQVSLIGFRKSISYKFGYTGTHLALAVAAVNNDIESAILRKLD
jgi:hypothetical protein